MAASLTRFSTRGLAQVASRCMAMKTRQQLMSSSVAFKLVANSQPVLSAAMYKIQPSAIRMYSSDAKLNKTQVEERVLDILKNFDRVKENPAKPEVKLESHLAKDLGLDSLDQVEIIVQIEDAFGYEIPDSDYEKLLTANEIVNYVLKRAAAV